MKRLEGKVAIISGAAQGMGAATARIFAAQGAKIVIGDVQADKLHEVAVSIGPAAIAVKLDVREEADWQNAVATAVEKFGKLTTLVNNAAVVLFGATEELDKQAAQRLLDINVIGTLMGVKHAVPALRANGGGVIVNISSIDGLTGFNGRIAYTASKWAVRGITKALAYEYGPEGIRVISVHPGGVNTIMGNPYGQPAEELREASAGTAPSTTDRESGFELERVAAHLEAAAAVLDAATVAPEACSATAARLRELAGASQGIEGQKLDLESLERTLTVLEEKLFAALTAAAPEELLVSLKAHAARELAPYRSRMGAVQLRQVERQFVQKQLLVHYNLPRLSLFYMSQR